jgi:hypothetical protein
MGNVSCKKTCSDLDKVEVSLVYADEETPVQAVDMMGLFVEGKHCKLSQAPVETFEVVLERTGVYAKSIGMVISPDDNPKHLVVDRLLERSLISEWNEKQQDDRKMVRPGDVIRTVNGVQGDGERMLKELQSSEMGSTLMLRVEERVNLESISTTSGGSGSDKPQQYEELKVSEGTTLDSFNMMNPIPSPFSSPRSPDEATPADLTGDLCRAPFEVTLERTGPHANSIGLIVSADDHPRHLVVDNVLDVGLVADWNLLQEDNFKKVRPGDILLSVNSVRGNSKLMLKEMSRKSGSTVKFTVDGTMQTDIAINMDVPIQVDDTKQKNKKKTPPAGMPPSQLSNNGWV